MLDKRLFFLLLLLLGCYREKPKMAMVSSPDFDKAIAFEDKQPDSAFYYFNKMATSSKDSLLIARAYNNMAEIQTDAGDYFGSQETVTTSLKFLNEQKTSNYHCLSADYNELGMNSFNLKNYTAAIGYYDLAIKYSDSSQWTAIYLNNKSNAYQQNKDYRSALKIYREDLVHVKPVGIEYARIIFNMARTKWLQDPHYNAAPEFLRALAIRLKENDRWGQNSSYIHLSDYYMRSHPDSALFYAGKLYAVATQINSPDDRLDALQKLIHLGTPQDAKRYFELYQALNDSVQTARNAAKNQFALIRYDTEKNKIDNLNLQKDNAEKKFQVTGLLLFLLISAVLIVFWYRKMRWDAKEKMLRLSQKVHDVVANGIYRVMSEVEHGQAIDKEHLLDQLEVMYEQSRDITYENENVLTDFALEIQTLLNSFKGGSVKLGVSGLDAVSWEVIGKPVKQELLPILQELMVNMTKHSQATQSSLAFEFKEGCLLVDYRDNGVGLPKDLSFGNGLRNTGNRIEALKGRVKFATDGGAHIHLTIPIS
jgi:tetratricopeptide (TPR) repeat protein